MSIPSDKVKQNFEIKYKRLVAQLNDIDGGKRIVGKIKWNNGTPIVNGIHVNALKKHSSLLKEYWDLINDVEIAVKKEMDGKNKKEK